MTCKSYKILVSGLTINNEFSSFVEELIFSIKKARKEILILNYLIQDEFILEHIKSKLKYNSLKIFIITNDKVLKKAKLLQEMCLNFPGLLEVKIYKKPIVHSKLIVIDEQIVIIGSHNITYAGLHKNIEISLLIESTDIAEKFRKLFFMLWNRQT